MELIPMNDMKEIVPSTRYTLYGDFYEGELTPVYKEINGHRKWGFANDKREVVIPYQYNDADCFTCGLAPVANDNWEYGYIDETGKVILPFHWKANYYIQCWRFFDERAIVSDGKHYGIIDPKGKYITPCKWKAIERYVDGRARVQDSCSNWGFIDMDGNEISPCKWAEAFDFKEGLAVVKDYYRGWGTIDKNGENVTPLNWKIHQMFSFNEGVAEASVSFPQNPAEVKYPSGVIIRGYTYWGFVDRTGKWVIPPQYWSNTQFCAGLAGVESFEGKWGLINKEGDLVVPCKWRDLSGGGGYHNYCDCGVRIGKKYVKIDFSYDDLGRLTARRRIEVPDGHGWWKDQVFKPEFCKTNLSTYFDKNALQLPGELRRLADRLSDKGYGKAYLEETIIQFILHEFQFCWLQYSAVEQNGRFGFVNDFEQQILPAQWAWASDFHEGLAIVMDDNGKKGFINTKGELVVPCQWKDVNDFRKGVAVVTDEDGCESLIDQTGRIIIPRQEGKGIEIDSDFLVWHTWTDENGRKRKWNITAEAEKQVDRSIAYRFGRDYVPKPIDKSEIVLHQDTRLLMRRMAGLGYTKVEVEKLLKDIAQEGYRVYRYKKQYNA